MYLSIRRLVEIVQLNTASTWGIKSTPTAAAASASTKITTAAVDVSYLAHDPRRL